jgi:farnesyl-diphosphate farnesyltransferase
MALQHDALDVLKATSGTLYVPITRLPGRLQEAVAAAYLCLRAVGEIQAHATLDAQVKVGLLRSVSRALERPFTAESLTAPLIQEPGLPEATERLGEWVFLAPEPIAPRIWEATAILAERLADWVTRGWRIQTEAELDSYTYATAGSAGLLFSDLWAWYDGTRTHRGKAVGFGRGLGAVNLMHSRTADLARGADLFPSGWGMAEMQAYARRHLALAESYVRDLPPGPALDFCRVPLTLAYAGVEAVEPDEAKRTRSALYHLVDQATHSQRRLR